MQLLANIDVPDLEAAIGFYTRALGLKLERRLFGGAVAELSGASTALYLLSKAEGSMPVATIVQRRDYRRHWTPVHLDFVVADLDSALTRALEAGARCEEPPQDHAYGRLALLSDPFGHGFCLLQWHGRGYAEGP
jgi:predicted enzyme related to lactoylglutathione lyase